LYFIHNIVPNPASVHVCLGLDLMAPGPDHSCYGPKTN